MQAELAARVTAHASGRVHVTDRAGEDVRSRDHLLAFGMLAVGAILRGLYMFHHHVNVDEPQHLHVAWVWTQGLLIYRDAFDNHSPLFSMLMAPLVGLIGERSDIVVWMRFAMVPFVALSLWATWRIGRRLFSSRSALWAVVVTAVFPSFLLCSVEYRTDQLWTTVWLWALAVLVGGSLTVTRSFFVGLLMGASFGASMKTSLLATTLAVAAGLTLLTLVRREARPPLGWLASRAAAAIVGLALVPAGIGAYFSAHRAWSALVYNTVQHNLVPRLGHDAPWRWPVALAVLPLLYYMARRLVNQTPDARVGARRALLLTGATLYFTAVNFLWPLVTRQDFLPLIPLAAIFVTPLLVKLDLWMSGTRFARAARLVPVVVVVALEVGPAVAAEPPWRDDTSPQRAFLSEVLRLTRPGDPLMDLKGECVFRTRSYYYALEHITRVRIARGLIRDDIATRLIATKTAFVTEDSDQFPPGAGSFMKAHYLAVGRLRALGCWLEPVPGDPATPRPFDIVIPGRYVVVADFGPGQGQLDGEGGAGPSQLGPGPHAYRAGPHEGRVAVLWASAVERGFSPFPGVGAGGR